MEKELAEIRTGNLVFSGIPIKLVGEFNHRKTGETHYIYETGNDNEMIILRGKSIVDLFNSGSIRYDYSRA